MTAEVVQTATVAFELQEVGGGGGPFRYRARIVDGDWWGEGDDPREAIRGACLAATNEEFDAAIDAEGTA